MRKVTKKVFGMIGFFLINFLVLVSFDVFSVAFVQYLRITKIIKDTDVEEKYIECKTQESEPQVDADPLISEAKDFESERPIKIEWKRDKGFCESFEPLSKYAQVKSNLESRMANSSSEVKRDLESRMADNESEMISGLKYCIKKNHEKKEKVVKKSEPQVEADPLIDEPCKIRDRPLTGSWEIFIELANSILEYSWWQIIKIGDEGTRSALALLDLIINRFHRDELLKTFNAEISSQSNFFCQKEYLVLCVFLAIATILATVLLVGSFVLAHQNPDTEKLSAYECGFEPYENTRHTFEVRFCVIAVIFIIFDIEVMFLIPWCFSISKIGLLGFWSMVDFMLELGLGFFYVWYVKALDWE